MNFILNMILIGFRTQHIYKISNKFISRVRCSLNLIFSNTVSKTVICLIISVNLKPIIHWKCLFITDNLQIKFDNILHMLNVYTSLNNCNISNPGCSNSQLFKCFHRATTQRHNYDFDTFVINNILSPNDIMLALWEEWLLSYTKDSKE